MRLRARLSPNREPIGQRRGRVLRGGERLSDSANSDSVDSSGTRSGGGVGVRSAAVSARTAGSSSLSVAAGPSRVTASSSASSSTPSSGSKPPSGSRLSPESKPKADSKLKPDPKLKAPPRLEPSERPGASGHRFGPDLACSECGIQWDVHQREPHPCKTDLDDEADAFLRRPAPPAAGAGADCEPGSSNETSLADDSARSAGPGPGAATDASADPTGDR